MSTFKPTSIQEHVSKKMSVWVLILVVGMIVAVFSVSFVQSRQMFQKQIASWVHIAPRQAITNLIDSDDFSIEREVKFLESTGLFASFCIQDNQKRVVAQFGEKSCERPGFAIKDDAGAVWGYYSYQPDFYRFIAPFLLAGSVFLALVILLFFFIRSRIQSNLGHEFLHFHQFLQEIETLTEKIQDVYHYDVDVVSQPLARQSAEQAIINRAIHKLVEEIKKANFALKEAISAAEKKRYQEELTETALQVAHDIGSPIAVLESAVQSKTLTLSGDGRAMLLQAAARLRDISYSLLKRGQYQEPAKIQPLLPLINRVVAEKRLEYHDRPDVQVTWQPSGEAYSLFAMIRGADFCRLLSNIANNAMEAIETSGSIDVALFVEGKELVVQVSDNGKGIPADVLPRLGEEGMTYGKKNGNGLGLFHAKTTLQALGGRLVIESEEGRGATVSIYLPKSPVPEWFVSDIYLTEQQTIVVIDDDQSIHDLWHNRFVECRDKVNMVHLYTPDELNAWLIANPLKKDSAIYLCDYEFTGHERNGLDLITQHQINRLSVLVTARYDNEKIMMRCEMQHIKLLPKELAAYLPIKWMN